MNRFLGNLIFHKFLKLVMTRFNMSGSNCFERLKINQDVSRGTLSINTKFHSYNCRGWGDIRNLGFSLLIVMEYWI